VQGIKAGERQKEGGEEKLYLFLKVRIVQRVYLTLRQINNTFDLRGPLRLRVEELLLLALEDKVPLLPAIRGPLVQISLLGGICDLLFLVIPRVILDELLHVFGLQREAGGRGRR